MSEYILPILTENHTKLYEKCSVFYFEHEDPDLIRRQLSETMVKNNGCGLAGSQVGYMSRVFAIGETDNTKVFFNPTIIEYGENIDLYKEGCLSFPGLYLNIKRPTSTVINYQDHTGKEYNETLEGFWSRVFQHELDHLNGITFKDRVARLTLDMARKKQRKILNKRSKNT